tara:strand:- start:157 stop:936 length:780 start_codon:yes stop_codon:yes gene_type:complete
MDSKSSKDLYTPQNIRSSDNLVEDNNDIKFNNLNLGNKFWTENFKVLTNKEEIYEFIPTDNMTLIEKLNAIFRLSIILSIALYLFTSNTNYLYICILTGLFTYFIYYYQKENVELYMNSISNDKYNEIQADMLNEEKNKSEIVPTVNNPFMNINLITSNKTQEAPPSSWNDDDMKDKIEEKFDYNLYRDVSDLYGKSNSQRQYYTAPSTTIPNNQTGFAKWLYGEGPTCKEKSIYCAPEMPAYPYLSTNNPYKDTNQMY